MKRQKAISTVLSLGLAVLLSACGTQEEITTSYSPAQMSGILWGTQAAPGQPYTLALGDDGFSDYLAAYYAFEPDILEDGAIRYAGGTDASEIAVFGVRNAADIPTVEDSLQRYIQSRIGDFAGYMPDQVAKLEHSIVTTSGSYVALLICDAPADAQAAFALCFQEGAELPAPLLEASAPASTQPVPELEPEDPYDAAAVLAAWRTGNPASLSDKNRAVLDACKRVVDQVITDSMSDYDKELAIHDWIVQWAEYDPEAASHAPDAVPNPNNDNPYGLLIDRQAICTGYTGTFQLFMDMLDIECITVNGWAHSDKSDHAWNMVRLDGDWYCVDATWNDPVGLEEYDALIQHDFFNVTSQWLRDTDHQWEEGDVPEATGTRYQWRPEDQ